jgi:hypothetical protein
LPLKKGEPHGMPRSTLPSRRPPSRRPNERLTPGLAGCSAGYLSENR